MRQKYGRQFSRIESPDVKTRDIHDRPIIKTLPDHEIIAVSVKHRNMCARLKGKEQSFFSNNFIVLNHIQICFITIYDGCLT